MFSPEQIELFRIIIDCAKRSRVDVYVVGGTIRDLYLQNNHVDQDLDFIVVGDAIAFAATCHEIVGGELKKFPDFMTAKICDPNSFKTIKEIDAASARRELYAKPGKLPIVSLSTIQEDLKRRDFSINAMAVAVRDLLEWGVSSFAEIEKLLPLTLDLFNGYADIENKIVRILHDASFVDDPTRLFRAARYAGRIQGVLDSHTAQLFRDAIRAGALETISRERKLNEMRKIANEKNAASIIDILHSNGLFEAVAFYRSDRHLAVLESLKDLSALEGLKSELSYEVLLRIFFYNSCADDGDDASAREAYANLGFGRKEINRLATDIRQTMDLRLLKKMSDAGLVFNRLRAANEDHAVLDQLLKEREILQ